MKSGFVCLACLLGAFSLAPAFERAIILPDSFGGLKGLLDIALNPVTNRLYVIGESGGRIVVIDGATRRRVGAVALPPGLWPWRATCCPATGQLFILDEADRLAVVDCSRDSLASVLGFSEGLYDLCASPDGSRLYVHAEAPRDGILHVIDPATGNLRTSLPVPSPYTDDDEGLSSRLLYEPGRARLYCLGEPQYTDADIAVIDGIGDSVLASITLPDMDVGRAVYDSRRDLLLCAGYYGYGFALAIIDAATNTLVDSILLPRMWDWPVDAVLNPFDDRLYVFTDASTLLVIDIDRRVVEDVIYSSDDCGIRLALFPGGRRLCCANDDYTIRIVDCAARTVVADIEIQSSLGVGVNPNDSLVFYAEYFRDLVSFVDSDGCTRDEVRTACDIGAALFDDARGLVYFADRSQHNVLVYDAATAEPLGTVPVGGRPDVFCVNPRAPRLYCARYNDKIAVVDLELMALDTVLSVDDDPDNLCYDPTTDKLYVACEGDDVIHVIDGATYETVAVLPAAESPRAMCVDTIAGRLFCCLAQTDEILVIDTRADTIITRLAVGDSPRTLCFDPARRRVYCANFSGNSVTVIDAVGLRVVGTVGGLGRSPAAAALDPAFGRLYCKTSASIDVIDCTGDSLVQHIPFGGIGSVALDRSRNSLFVIESDPGRVVALDAATGEEVRSWDTLYYPSSIACGESFDQLYVVSSASRIYVLDKPVLANALTSPTGPTHLKSELTLLGTRAATVHDITGRRVAGFSPGRNDLSRLPAGIYFICREGERETAKVVITR
ncbi:MAG: hypothetical protein R6X13_11460 [bacterium]